MILSNECWMKNTCKKYLKNENCECRFDNVFCPKLFKINELYNLSLLSENQRKRIDLMIDSDGTDRDQFMQLKTIENDIVNFVKNGNNLYIYSQKVGNGKTSWATRLIQAYINKIWIDCDLECKVLFINVPRFLLALKDNISKESEYISLIKENVLNVDLVVWDDIGTKSATTFEAEHLLSMIDTRINYDKSNIFTSNVDLDQLSELLGARLASRIVNRSYRIEFNGLDKRCIWQ